MEFKQKIKSLFTIQNLVLLLLLGAIGYQQTQITDLQEGLSRANTFLLKQDVDEIKRDVKNLRSDVMVLKLDNASEKVRDLEARVSALEGESLRRSLYVIR